MRHHFLLPTTSQVIPAITINPAIVAARIKAAEPLSEDWDCSWLSWGRVVVASASAWDCEIDVVVTFIVVVVDSPEEVVDDTTVVGTDVVDVDSMAATGGSSTSSIVSPSLANQGAAVGSDRK